MNILESMECISWFTSLGEFILIVSGHQSDDMLIYNLLFLCNSLVCILAISLQIFSFFLFQESNTCSQPRCKARTTVIFQLCPFCRNTFCLAHHMAEVHGCGDLARQHARTVSLVHVEIDTINIHLSMLFIETLFNGSAEKPDIFYILNKI